MSNDLFLNRCVSSGSLSLSMSLAICLFLFCFVRLFLRLSFIQILDLVVLSYGITLRVPFTSEHFCGGLFLGLSPLAPLYCRSPLFHVSCGFFLFWLLLFSVLFSGCHVRAPFFSVRLFRVFFFPGTYSTQLSFTGSVLSSLQRLDPFTSGLAFSARACSLAFLCLAILFLGICRAVFW